MSYIIGIDIGGSTTKIVGLKSGELITPMFVKAHDPITSIFGAFGKFIDYNRINLSDIDKIMMTGVGASYIDRPIYGISTGVVREFLANGLGGLYISGLKAAVIVSMGTGTSFVKAEGDNITHIGGTGIGGGTIVGLAGRLLNIRDIDILIDKAKEGDLSRIDLMVKDITKETPLGLTPETTASNFGNISDLAEPGDIALGIFNMVFQSIATASVFAVGHMSIKDVVLIGNLSTIPQCGAVLDSLSSIMDAHFIIPDNSEYATAVGAALAFDKGREYLGI